MAIKRQDPDYVYHKVGDYQIVFEIANEDLSGDPQDFGYLSDSGSWLIQKRTISTGIYLYAIGASAYGTAWTGKASLTYTTFDAI